MPLAGSLPDVFCAHADGAPGVQTVRVGLFSLGFSC